MLPVWSLNKHLSMRLSWQQCKNKWQAKQDPILVTQHTIWTRLSSAVSSLRLLQYKRVWGTGLDGLTLQKQQSSAGDKKWGSATRHQLATTAHQDSRIHNNWTVSCQDNNDMPVLCHYVSCSPSKLLPPAGAPLSDPTLAPYTGLLLLQLPHKDCRDLRWSRTIPL